MIERERRFLLARTPRFADRRVAFIAQGYFFKGDAASDPLRVRHERHQLDDTVTKDIYALTKKFQLKPGAYGVSEEKTIPISPEEFELFWPLAHYRVEKERRYVALPNDLTAEVDSFRGRLDGYQTVEVEFPDEITSDSFQPPEWFGQEITPQPWATNSVYAQLTYAELTQLIASLTPTTKR